jgi:hypothetical protein
MKILYSCPYWGSESLPPEIFTNNAISDDYNGVELLLQPPDAMTDQFMSAIDIAREKNNDFYFIALQLVFPAKESVSDYIKKMENNLASISSLNPLFINSHTGKDYYSFDDNCRVIEAAMNFSAKNNVRILHETHRSRFAFHTATLLPYLEKFPEMELTGDLSHFCVVSESMLENQEDLLEKIFPHISHLHARVGYEQGPQVNDPKAPEWNAHVNIFLNWWQQIIELKQKAGQQLFTITPEFGPVPYMPAMPFTQEPTSVQWDNNLFIKKLIQSKFTISTHR